MYVVVPMHGVIRTYNYDTWFMEYCNTNYYHDTCCYCETIIVRYKIDLDLFFTTLKLCIATYVTLNF